MTTAATFLVLALVVTPLTGEDASGVWNLEMVFSPNGAKSTGVCRFKQDGNKLTGNCGSESVPITGEINGKNVSWQFEAQQGGRGHVMTFSGVLDEPGTTIKGNCAVVDGPEGTFTARKAESTPS